MSDTKKAAGCAFGLMAVFIIMPIWYYLLYRILQAVHADTAMWVAYWIYLPVGIIVSSAKAILDAS